MSDTEVKQIPGIFRKKPVEILALQWLGDNIEAALDFLKQADLPDIDDGMVGTGIGHTPTLGTLEIPTLEGVMTASPGDWIIIGIAREAYPCKPDIFEATYEEVI